MLSYVTKIRRRSRISWAAVSLLVHGPCYQIISAQWLGLVIYVPNRQESIFVLFVSVWRVWYIATSILRKCFVRVLRNKAQYANDGSMGNKRDKSLTVEPAYSRLEGIKECCQLKKKSTSKGSSRRREKIVKSCWWWWGPSLVPRLPPMPLPPVALVVV